MQPYGAVAAELGARGIVLMVKLNIVEWLQVSMDFDLLVRQLLLSQLLSLKLCGHVLVLGHAITTRHRWILYVPYWRRGYSVGASFTTGWVSGACSGWPVGSASMVLPLSVCSIMLEIGSPTTRYHGHLTFGVVSAELRAGCLIQMVMMNNLGWLRVWTVFGLCVRRQ